MKIIRTKRHENEHRQILNCRGKSVMPKRKNWVSFAGLGKAGDGFLKERPALFDFDKSIFYVEK